MESGIFIPYAIFCENFEQHEDGSVTIGRTIDHVTCIEKSSDLSRKSAELPLLRVRYAVCFKSAEPVPGAKVALRCRRPSGEEFEVGTKGLDLAGDYKGTFLTGTLDIKPIENGWHVFEVTVRDAAKAQMVLHLSVVRATDGGGTVQIPVSHPNPPEPKAAPRRTCYAAPLGSCSKKMSREHFISDNFLRQLNRSGGLRVGGLPWQQPGEIDAIPPSALTGKVLCERHNSRLSRLDALAGRFFETLNSIHAACTEGASAALSP